MLCHLLLTVLTAQVILALQSRQRHASSHAGDTSLAGEHGQFHRSVAPLSSWRQLSTYRCNAVDGSHSTTRSFSSVGNLGTQRHSILFGNRREKGKQAVASKSPSPRPSGWTQWYPNTAERAARSGQRFPANAFRSSQLDSMVSILQSPDCLRNRRLSPRIMGSGWRTRINWLLESRQHARCNSGCSRGSSTCCAMEDLGAAEWLFEPLSHKALRLIVF